ncbi:helix-turn-helix transcriptional regulator [Burkholderia contaminans]|uniref:helix-turn-helix domain-containing protein n=1 Tax=Burkholderia contaminans TaxID=488447 RepID=UPI002415C85F|nr:helix-turn-helix transcriptional regulator [Burkholderia contaminans]WFN09437.1 helix-turn-helix domain-containing protein [Burkholderia contaminans]
MRITDQKKMCLFLINFSTRSDVDLRVCRSYSAKIRGNLVVELHVTDFGKFVRTRRKALKLTQTELARRLGVDDAYISAIERGVRTPGNVVFIDQLGRALALDADGRLELEAVAESSKRLLRLSDPLPLYKYQVIAALVRDQHLTEADMDTIAKVHAAIVQIRNATAAAVSIDGGTM